MNLHTIIFFQYSILQIVAQTSFDLQTSTGFADFTHFPDGSASAMVSSVIFYMLNRNVDKCLLFSKLKDRQHRKTTF